MNKKIFYFVITFIFIISLQIYLKKKINKEDNRDYKERLEVIKKSIEEDGNNFVPPKKLLAIQNDLKFLFNELINICNKYNIEYWANGGTLLGCMRHKDIIPWDDDVDICMTTKSVNMLKQAISNDSLTRKNFRIAYNDFIYRFEKHGGSGVYIDIFEMKKIGNHYDFNLKFNRDRFKLQGKITIKELYPLKNCKFGNLIVKIPNNSTPYLTRGYGDWKKFKFYPPHHKYF